MRRACRAWLAQSVHDLRSVARVDSVRRVRKRSRQCAPGRKRRHSPECLSRPGFHRARSATSARFSIPNIRTAKVRIEVRNPGPDASGNVCDRHVPRPQKRDSAPPFRPPRFCICTIAIGSTCPTSDKQFRRVEVVGGDMLPEQHAGDCLGNYAGPAGGRQRARIPEHGGTVMIRSLVDFALNNRFVVLEPGAASFRLGHHLVQAAAGRSLSRCRQHLGAGDHAMAGPRGGRSRAASHHSRSKSR